MTNRPKFSGVGVAMVTPFADNGSVDFDSLTALVRSVSEGGVDYLVVMGTTAESPTLTKDEKQQILTHVVQNNTKNLPIVYGIGGNCTAEVIREIQNTDLTGVSAILSVAPYYNKPNQTGIYAHFAAILESSPLPIILYNIPGRTGINMTPATTLSLAQAFPEKVIGVKEASGNLNQMTYIIKDRPSGFLVISGDDNISLPLIALGGDGVISVSANSFPRKFSSMIHLALEGKIQQAAAQNLVLHAATDMLFEEGSPTGVKAVLTHKKIMKNNLRLPLVAASEELKTKIIAEVTKYNLE